MRGAEGTSNLTPATQLHLGGLETLSKWSQWRWQRLSFGSSVSPASSVCHFTGISSLNLQDPL